MKRNRRCGEGTNLTKTRKEEDSKRINVRTAPVRRNLPAWEGGGGEDRSRRQ